MECGGLHENELQRLILILNHQGLKLLKGLKKLGGVPMPGLVCLCLSLPADEDIALNCFSSTMPACMAPCSPLRR